MKFKQLEDAVRNKFNADFGIIPQRQEDRIAAEHAHIISGIKKYINAETSRWISKLSILQHLGIILLSTFIIISDLPNLNF